MVAVPQDGQDHRVDQAFNNHTCDQNRGHFYRTYNHDDHVLYLLVLPNRQNLAFYPKLQIGQNIRLPHAPVPDPRHHGANLTKRHVLGQTHSSNRHRYRILNIIKPFVSL